MTDIELIPVAGGSVFKRQLIADYFNHRYGLQSPSRLTAQFDVELGKTFDGVNLPIQNDSWSPPTASDWLPSALKISDRAMPLRRLLALGARQTTQTLKQQLEKQYGLAFQTRKLDSEFHSNATLRIADLVHIIEVRRQDGSILAEGKSLEPEQALRSAIGEAIERLAAMHIPEGNFAVTNSERLRSAGYEVPNLQIGARDCYSPPLITDWTLSVRVTDGAAVAVPADLMTYNRAPTGPTKAFASQTTAGIASGPTRDFACLKSALELMEMDAYAIHIRTGLSSGVIPLDEISSQDTASAELVKFIEESGGQIHAFNIQFDHPIPIVHCMISISDDGLPSLSHGLGSGLSLAEAFQNALVEAIQVFSDLAMLIEQDPHDAIVPTDHVAATEYYWANPSNANRILGPLIAGAGRYKGSESSCARHAADLTFNELLISLNKSLGSLVFCELKSPLSSYSVISSFADEVVSHHDLTREHEARLATFMSTYGVPHETGIPILT